MPDMNRHLQKLQVEAYRGAREGNQEGDDPILVSVILAETA